MTLSKISVYFASGSIVVSLGHILGMGIATKGFFWGSLWSTLIILLIAVAGIVYENVKSKSIAYTRGGYHDRTVVVPSIIAVAVFVLSVLSGVFL